MITKHVLMKQTDTPRAGFVTKATKTLATVN